MEEVRRARIARLSLLRVPVGAGYVGGIHQHSGREAGRGISSDEGEIELIRRGIDRQDPGALRIADGVAVEHGSVGGD